MAKYYIKSGQCRSLLVAPTPLDAAIKSVLTWKIEKRKMQLSIHVSEVGFEGDHPHHELDVIIPTSFVKNKLKDQGKKMAEPEKKDDDIFPSYEELMNHIQKLTPEQRLQKVQVVQAGNCDDSEPAILQPCFSIGTVESLYHTKDSKEHQYVRDCKDGKHYPESVVLLTDISGYENYQVYRECGILTETLEKIKDGHDNPKELARVALERIEKLAEKKKSKVEKLIKECV